MHESAHRIGTMIALSACFILVPACHEGNRMADANWHAVTDTLGDTIVIRTVSGSVWRERKVLTPEVTIGVLEGENEYMLGHVDGIAADREGYIYAYDAQGPALRKYDADGRYVTTLGREGGGPGEYRGSDGGLTVMPDGRVALRDVRNNRILIYGRDGTPAGSFRLNSGVSTHRRLVADGEGALYTPYLLRPDALPMEWRLAMVRFGPDGTPTDTIPEPTWKHEPQRLEAQSVLPSGQTGASRNPVPFTGTTHTVFSPRGYWVGGLSTAYAIDLYRSAAPVLRIVAAWIPVPVGPGERTNAEERATWAMRFRDPNWRWNGPPIPDTKPPFRDLFVGDDGRVWVLLHRPARPIEDVEESPGNRRPPLRWREPVEFDVFEPDGTYLGRVAAPDGFQVRPAPMFRGDQAWAVLRGALGIDLVARFRIASPSP